MSNVIAQPSAQPSSPASVAPGKARNAILSVDDLYLDYGSGASANAILKGVSMDLQKGEVVSLLGPSGSGKTTLLRAVAGLEGPKAGTIRIGDRTIYDSKSKLDMPAEERNLGLVFQSYALWPHKTVFDNVAYGLKLRKLSSSEISERVKKVLPQLGLGHLGERFPHQLSGGQQQRVAIARALVYNPPVILLDEPLSNLDAKLREEARAFLRELIVRLGLSALMVTHDQTEAMAISDRILLLNNGKIEQQGTPEEMYATPDTLFTAEFMGSNNRLPGKVIQRNGSRVTLEINGTTVHGTARGGSVGMDPATMIRLEQVRVLTAPAENAIQLPLSTCMYLGDRWECLFHRMGSNEISVRAYTPRKLAPGDYWLELPEESLWVF
jgi:iron(III) transport system ATP-binding protein